MLYREASLENEPAGSFWAGLHPGLFQRNGFELVDGGAKKVTGRQLVVQPSLHFNFGPLPKTFVNIHGRALKIEAEDPRLNGIVAIDLQFLYIVGFLRPPAPKIVSLWLLSIRGDL
jgi:hypothetical protein